MVARASILLILFTIAGCAKQSYDPVFNDFPLIGAWAATNGGPMFTIRNVNNEGTDEKYYEYTQGSRRLLRRTYQNLPTTYEIVFINDRELHLVNVQTGGVMEFNRWDGW